MQPSGLVFSEKEIELLKKLAELVLNKKFASLEEKRMFWQDVRILQYEYFGGVLTEDMSDLIGVLCGEGGDGDVSQRDP